MLVGHRDATIRLPICAGGDMCREKILFICLPLLAAAALPGLARAQPSQDVRWCSNSNFAFSLDQQIRGCTAVIQARPAIRYLASAYHLRGLAYYEKGQYDLALEDYNQSIRPDSTDPDPDVFTGRGNIYLNKQQYDRAIEDYNRAIRLKPDATNLYNRGNAYYGKRQFDRAIEDYNQAIRLNPNDANAWFNRGQAKHERGDSSGGNADIARARQINPNVGR